MGRPALISERATLTHRWRRIMRKLSYLAGTLALSLVAATAAQPALGKDRMQDRSSRAGFEARADAIRECNNDAAKFPEYSWGNHEFDTYRACMAQKGQAE
jgi:hypothetical protein